MKLNITNSKTRLCRHFDIDAANIREGRDKARPIFRDVVEKSDRKELGSVVYEDDGAAFFSSGWGFTVNL
jgi:hypothetical protein